ncbi:hypothetical protein HA402_008944 [Bradysia odoriphaga]|nr:hypothetical protein HA402_008944 [Bradysia odoriphaga]
MKGTMVIVLVGIAVTMTMATDHSKRSKRFLIFPPTSPTRMQLICGIGIPVDLEYESVTIGYVLKSEYLLPDNTSMVLHFLQDPFDPVVRPIQRRRRSAAPALAIGSQNDSDHYEKYDVEAVQIGTGLTTKDEEAEHYSNEWNEVADDEEFAPEDYRITKQNDFQTFRWTLYKGLEAMAERKGLAGRACMLRTICESAHAPFSFSSGIVAEMMHILLTPSSSKDTVNDHSLNEYYHAEEMGKSGAPCDHVFSECTISLVDKFSGIYTTMDNIIKMVG